MRPSRPQLVITFPDRLPRDARDEVAGVGIRTPLPEQPIAIFSDARVLSAEVGEEARHGGDRGSDLQLVESLCSIGQVAPEGVLRERQRNQRAGTA